MPYSTLEANSIISNLTAVSAAYGAGAGDGVSRSCPKLAYRQIT